MCEALGWFPNTAKLGTVAQKGQKFNSILCYIVQGPPRVQDTPSQKNQTRTINVVETFSKSV